MTGRLRADAAALVARVLSCPDCQGALDEGLRCACGRSFQPDADGIISALPSGMSQESHRKEEIQAEIESRGVTGAERGIVQYEQAFHDEQAAHYDSLFADPLPLKSYYRHLVRSQIHGQLRGAPFIVDLCCGTGKSSGPLVERGLTVIGMDVSREMLRIYRRKYSGDAAPILIHADASRPPLRGGSCVALSMIGGLHHIPDKAGSLKSCSDALAPGGLLILHEPLKTGRHSTLARAVENLYVLADPARVWAAVRRRLGMKTQRRQAEAAVCDFTPYEKPFSSTDELLTAMPPQMQPLVMRGQGVLSFREFPPLLQRSIAQPLAGLVVMIDHWLSTAGVTSLSGDALFAVFQKAPPRATP